MSGGRPVLNFAARLSDGTSDQNEDNGGLLLKVFCMRPRTIFLAALCWGSIMSASVQGQQPQAHDIGTLIEKISHETDSRTRYDLAYDLLKVARQVPASEQINDRMIDDLVGLLDDRVIRAEIAGALGWLGPRAKRAVPALEKALEEEEAAERAMIVGPDVSTADGIRGALKMIVPPPPE